MRQVYYFKVRIFSFLIAFFCYSTHFSQKSTPLNSVFSSNVESFKSSSVPISFSGFYRFLGYARNQNETFQNINGKSLVLLSSKKRIIRARFGGKIRYRYQ